MRELEVSGIIDGDNQTNCPNHKDQILEHTKNQQKAFLEEFDPVLAEVKKVFNSEHSKLPSETVIYLQLLNSLW